MSSDEILSILSSVLGEYRQTGKDNYAFFCPQCNHYKKKLEINLTSFKYHCWTCIPKLGGGNFYFFIKTLPNVPESYLSKIKEYTKTRNVTTTTVLKQTIYLPREFKSLTQSHSSIEYRHAMKYLKNRGVTSDDVKKYNIGFCEDGIYKDRIIIPSYAENGELNYFISRAFFDTMSAYKNPPVSKDVVAFESLIHWEYPIVLVEGFFDAIAVKRNAIPLIGKTLQPMLKNKLELHMVRDIYVCLDADAHHDAVEIAKTLLNVNYDRNVYLVSLGSSDPSAIGFVNMAGILKSAEPFDFKKLIFSKLYE